MRVLAEIPAAAAGLRPGTLRRRDLDAYARLLEQLGDARLVLVSGPAPGRHGGALSLAAAGAAGGRDAVLVECELAEPRLAEGLGLASAPGLGEYLRGEVPAERLLKPVALAGPGSQAAIQALVCIVAGRPEPNPVSLLGSERMRHTLASLREAYELVVLDGPGPDSAALAAVADSADAVLAWTADGEAPPLPATASGLVVEAAEPASDEGSGQRS